MLQTIVFSIGDKMSSIMNKDNFLWVDWIIREREAKGWSQSVLARKADLSRTAISLYEQRKRVNPDEKSLSRISIALGYPPETLLRIAGIISPLTETDETIERAKHIISTYKFPETKKQALDYLEFLLAQEDRGDHSASPSQAPLPSTQN